MEREPASRENGTRMSVRRAPHRPSLTHLVTLHSYLVSSLATLVPHVMSGVDDERREEDTTRGP